MLFRVERRRLLKTRRRVVIKKLRNCYLLSFAFTLAIQIALRFISDNDLLCPECWHLLKRFLSPNRHVHNLEIKGFILFLSPLRFRIRTAVLCFNSSAFLLYFQCSSRFAFRGEFDEVVLDGSGIFGLYNVRLDDVGWQHGYFLI